MGAHVSGQAAGVREGHAAGGAGVGAFAVMGALVSRQVAGLREGLSACGALKDELAPRPTLPPLARPSMAATRSVSRRPFPAPLASDHRRVNRHVLRLAECVSGQISV